MEPVERTLIRINPHQAGVVVAVLSVIYSVFRFLLTFFFGWEFFGWEGVGIALLGLVVSPILGYLGTAVFCWLLNIVLAWCGGILITWMESEQHSPASASWARASQVGTVASGTLPQESTAPCSTCGQRVVLSGFSAHMDAHRAEQRG